MNKAAHLLAAGAALLAMAAASCAAAAPKTTEAEPGWTVLLDAKNKGDWTTLGESNARMEDGALIFDGKQAGAPAAFLVSKASYKDFALHVEFWSSEEANSGVFIRCADPAKVTDRSCYEVNIYDKRPDPTYATGGVVHFAEVAGPPVAAGKWNALDITAQGRVVSVVLNGVKTSEFKSDFFLEGPIALQHGVGVIKFRKVAIKPL
jgi:hypothetical protein